MCKEITGRIEGPFFFQDCFFKIRGAAETFWGEGRETRIHTQDRTPCSSEEDEDLEKSIKHWQAAAGAFYQTCICLWGRKMEKLS